MTPSELLARIAATLKTEVGPAVTEEYPRSQAFFSAVVLGKMAAQLALEDEHAKADSEERLALSEDLRNLLDNGKAPPKLDAAFAGLAGGEDQELCGFIEVLYAERDALGEDYFEALLGRVRKYLRGAIDRRMEYAS